MEAEMNAISIQPLAPIAATERIEALDVVRGFALFGIFLMNIEFFNRTMNGIGEGMPLGLKGLDWLASWFIAYFVQGKFWTIFSMLFGMGFAVMLGRAQRADRSFIVPYLRRILALAVFGAVHYIFIWQGDILFSYGMAAGALMILSYGKWKPIVFALVSLIAVGFIPNLDKVWWIAGGLAFVGLVALYMRNGRRVSIRGRSLPLFSFILLIVGLVAAIAAIVLWALPHGPKEPRIPLTIVSITTIALALLSAKYREPVALRSLRVGATLYLLMGISMTIGGVVQYLRPAEPAPAPVVATPVAAPANDARAAKLDATSPAKTADAKLSAANAKGDGTADAKPVSKAGDKKTEIKPQKTEAEKAAEKKAEQARRLEQRRQKSRDEERILSKGTYFEAVLYRAADFPSKAAGDAGFAVSRCLPGSACWRRPVAWR